VGICLADGVDRYVVSLCGGQFVVGGAGEGCGSFDDVWGQQGRGDGEDCVGYCV
jgi:hypothetical protein